MEKPVTFFCLHSTSNTNKAPYYHKGHYWCSERCWRQEIAKKAENARQEAKEKKVITARIENTSKLESTTLFKKRRRNSLTLDVEQMTSISQDENCLQLIERDRKQLKPIPLSSRRPSVENLLALPRYGNVSEYGKDIKTLKFSQGKSFA